MFLSKTLIVKYQFEKLKINSAPTLILCFSKAGTKQFLFLVLDISYL